MDHILLFLSFVCYVSRARLFTDAVWSPDLLALVCDV